MKMVSRGVVLIAFAVACGGKSSTGNEETKTGVATRCDLAKLGLAGATAVPLWKPPPGCRSRGPAGDKKIDSEEQFRAHFGCPAGVRSGIDFARNELVIRIHQLSPAGIGGEIVDDGRTVTYVPHYRDPCPDDPKPMPVSHEVMFLLPAKAERQFAKAGGCTTARCEP